MHFYTKNAIIWLLDSGTWTIITFPYRWSGPFITTLKHRILGKMTEVAKKVMFGKLLVNFRNLSGKTWNDRLLHFEKNFQSIYIQHKLSRACSEYFSQAINSLITGWTVHTKNINPSVLRIELGLYIFRYRRSNQLLRR